ncbi:hypothetical protein DDQ68_07410 [Hymenobacter nivis]|uniref:MBL fold metallo-hydrolase n=1 Tax=Hymenobacter nivis TaxID=1850093 RepID=A0A2Z3GN35_9BACT|nr:hypothetical protein DDQ68_07410 [Hymenobacter nivis]
MQALAALSPAAIGCGHGPVIQGPQAAAGLAQLAAHYPVPAHGRYIHEAARTNASGVEHLPPACTRPAAPPGRRAGRRRTAGRGSLAAATPPPG